ncbi:membrane protein [Arthrobacter phage Paella]|nr:membrane protein [Arthrobacter phage Paella]
MSYWVTSAVIYAIAYIWALMTWLTTDRFGDFTLSLFYCALFVVSALMAHKFRKKDIHERVRD